MKTKLLTATAIAGILSVAIAANMASAEDHAAKEGMEKCYGVVKASQNDCAGGAHSCAGNAAKDGEGTEWVMVPTGTCAKLVNGSTTPVVAAPAAEAAPAATETPAVAAPAAEEKPAEEKH